MKGPRLVIDREGIFWAPLRREAMTIPWSSIERVEAWRSPGILIRASRKNWLEVCLSAGKSITIEFNLISPGWSAAVEHLEKIGRPPQRRHVWTFMEHMRHLRTTVPPQYPGND
jgi:hypothetical protein